MNTSALRKALSGRLPSAGFERPEGKRDYEKYLSENPV